MKHLMYYLIGLMVLTPSLVMSDVPEDVTVAQHMKEQEIVLNKAQEELGQRHAELKKMTGEHKRMMEHHPFADRGKARQMMIWRLVDELNLNEDTSAKFFPVFKDYLKSREEKMKEYRDLIRKIAENADNESVPVNVIKEDIQKLNNLDKAIDQEREKFLKKSEGILSERQYIKLIIFEDKLKGDLVERFREKRFMINAPEEGFDIPIAPFPEPPED